MIDLTTHIQAARQRQDTYQSEAKRLRAAELEQQRSQQMIAFRRSIVEAFGGSTATELGMTFHWLDALTLGRPGMVADCGHGVVLTLILETDNSWHVYRFGENGIVLDSRSVSVSASTSEQRRDQLLLAIGELIEAAGVEIEAALCS